MEQTDIFAIRGLEVGGPVSALYDVSRNGERFLAAFNAVEGTTSEVETIVVLNLFEELRARRRR